MEETDVPVDEPTSDANSTTNTTDGNNTTDPDIPEPPKPIEYDYSFCIADQTFIAVDLITPPKSFNENGVLGLAPSKNRNHIVHTLADQGKIDKEIVTLNLEDRGHVITFGRVNLDAIILENHAENNESVKYFSNVGQDKWGVLMDHVMYDGDKVRKYNNSGYAYYVHAKTAYIDSGNSSIQLPKIDFDFIKLRMMWQEPSIESRRVPNT